MESYIFDFLVESYGDVGLFVVFIIIIIAYSGKLRTTNEWFKRLIKKWLGIGHVPDDMISKSKRDEVEQKIDLSINMALYCLLHEYNADRAFIFEFHEYDNRISPIPYVYASNTYEAVDKTRKITNEKENLQNIPTSAIRWWVSELAEKGEIFLNSIDEIRETELETWKILESQQISSVYCTGLLDFYGNPIGFIGIDYCSGKASLIKREDDKRKFKLECIKVAGLLVVRRNGTLEQLTGFL